MSQLDPSSQPSPEREERLRANTTRVEIRPAERTAQLAVRGLACPACDMPLALGAPLGWNQVVSCPFCEELAPTRAYVRDSGWPEVELIARFR